MPRYVVISVGEQPPTLHGLGVTVTVLGSSCDFGRVFRLFVCVPVCAHTCVCVCVSVSF